MPDMFGRYGGNQALEILARLNQGVHDGHQQRFEPGHRAALPRFGPNSGHATTVLAHAEACALRALPLADLREDAPADFFGHRTLEEEVVAHRRLRELADAL